MSIPKEPRQLMINLMYLVLMALLALNISAEIMNAFYDLEDSMVTSSKLTTDAIKATEEGIQPLLNKKPKLKAPLNEGIQRVREYSNEFADQVDYYKKGLMVISTKAQEMTDAQIETHFADISIDNKEYYDEKTGNPKASKDKDWTTWWMVKQHKGDSLQALVNRTREGMIEIYKETINKVKKEAKLKNDEVEKRIANFEQNLTLGINDSIWQAKTDKATWAEYKFYQMPFAACMPTLEKIKADAKAAEAYMVNDLASLVGGREIKLNKFFPVINAKRGYVIKGEKFEAEVSIGAYSTEFAKTSTITVNGQRVSLNAQGKGQFSETANSLGKRTLKLTANVTNPLSGEKFSESSTFDYEVGMRSATASPTKMNVFYIGVDNPLEVAVAGANSNKVNVSCSGCTVNGSGGKYNVRASSPGNATIKVSAPGFSQDFKFRVKRIPDPVASFNPNKDESSGSLGNGSFKGRKGIFAALLNFDFEAKCQIQGFELTRVPKRQDAQRGVNSGGSYSGKVSNLVAAAKPGDIYYFDNIKARCPGDKAGRKLRPMVWNIK